VSRLEWLAIRAIWLGMAVLVTLAFDYGMERDADRLCASDATAYPECADR